MSTSRRQFLAATADDGTSLTRRADIDAVVDPTAALGGVPVLVEAVLEAESQRMLEALMAAVAGALGLLLLVLTALAMIFSGAVIGVFAPGLGADPRGALAAELSSQSTSAP